MGVASTPTTVISGNIGSPKRMDYTVIGEGVNSPAAGERVQGILGADPLVPSSPTEAQGHLPHARHRPRHRQGQDEPIGVYEVLDFHTEETFPQHARRSSACSRCTWLYRKGEFDRAIKQFQEALALHPGDKLSVTYIERCEYLKAHPPRACGKVCG